jgi:hypothetical protein
MLTSQTWRSLFLMAQRARLSAAGIGDRLLVPTEIGDQIDDFDAVASVHAAMTFDARDLRCARPFEVRSDFRTDRDLADFDAAVRLFAGFGACKIRRQGVVGRALVGERSPNASAMLSF